MQHEITEKHNVFEENGEVMCAGWARTPVFEYNSEQSKTSGKHNERDCYFISNTEVSLYLSVENLGMEFAVKIAVADDTTLVIFVPKLYRNYTFEYIPHGKKLDLSYNGSKITLSRADNTQKTE